MTTRAAYRAILRVPEKGEPKKPVQNFSPDLAAARRWGRGMLESAPADSYVEVFRQSEECVDILRKPVDGEASGA